LRLPALPIDDASLKFIERRVHVYEATNEGIDFVRSRVKKKVKYVKGFSLVPRIVNG